MATCTIIPGNVGTTLPIAGTPLSSAEIRAEFTAIQGEFTHAKTDIEAITSLTAAGTDNHIVRMDGTNSIQDSAATIDDNGRMYGYGILPEEVTTTTYTMLNTDSGKIKEFNNASAVTVILPPPATMPDGWGCTAVQTGAGQVTFSGPFDAYQAKTKIAGQYAGVTIYLSPDKSRYRVIGTMA